ncbi:MAG: rod-binding protein [Desulfuromonas sp.]|nr:rod-binding protein [Desulfuromonas sp.]
MNLQVDPRMYINQGTSLEHSAAARSDQRLEQTCAEFEAVMVQMMFKAMRGSEPEDGLLEKDMASEVYRDLFDGEVARDMAHNQSMGIGLHLYQQLQAGPR